MAEKTGVGWCHHTFNAWVGCDAVSPACDNCYARTFVTGRMGKDFDVRWRTSPANWRQPLLWNRKALAAGERRRVFCASLADVWDNQVPIEWLADLLDLIRETPALDWMLLTKRPMNILKLLRHARAAAINTWRDDLADWLDRWINRRQPPANVWLGVSVERQAEADERIPDLLATPAAVRFISAEPLLGPVDLTNIKPPGSHFGDAHGWSAIWRGNPIGRPALDLVIVGGENGDRPMHPDWVRSMRDQCAASGAAFFLKQWGAWAPHKPSSGGDLGGDIRAGRVRIVHPSGRSDVEISQATGGRSTEPGSQYMKRVGKKAAGRLLDGVEHNGMPVPERCSA